jgi:cupin 2 domain-containing protein
LRPKRPSQLQSGALTAGLPSGPQAAELFDEIVGGSGLRIERIVSAGQETPRGEWYDQESDEFVLLVSGAAVLRIDGETEDRVLRPGDWLILPAHCRHRVTWTQAAPPTIWLAVHYCAASTNSDGKE